MATANPAMNESVYRRAGYADSPAHVMTINGTAMKTLALVAILLIAGSFTWDQVMKANVGVQAGGLTITPTTAGLLILGVLGGLVTYFVTFLFPKVSPIGAPLYAAFEGLVLGAVSAIFQTRYHGIVTQAVGLTIGTLAVMLTVYATGIIRATEKFRIGITAAIGAICLVYLASFIMGMFGVNMPFIHSSGPIGIIFSLVVVVVAALSLILNFDFIERGAEIGAPKYMEWYGGFALLVTLVWLYLEILSLLSKLNRR
jgi:uncharacterized YccA/Bax inhibitor family protein